MDFDRCIRSALQQHLAIMPGLLPTVWQNDSPPIGFDTSVPYQKAYVLRAKVQSLSLGEESGRHTGILQVTLCYPSGSGTKACEQYGGLLQDHFAAGTVLQYGGVNVRIRGRASIGDPIAAAPYTVPVSIRFESIN